MAKPNKIDTYGLGDEVLRLKSEGYSLRETADKLNNQYQVKLSHVDVSRYIKKNFDKLTTEAAKDDKSVARANKLIEEAEEEFRAVKDELWSYIQDLKAKDDMSIRRVAALRELVKTFEAILKTAGAITKKKEITTTERTTVLDAAQSAGRWMQDLEAQGYIILKKKKKKEKETE